MFYIEKNDYIVDDDIERYRLFTEQSDNIIKCFRRYIIFY